jgi:hypothetical protein
MALLQRTKKLFGPLLDDLDCVRAMERGHGVAGRGLHEEEDEVAAATITPAPSASARTS